LGDLLPLTAELQLRLIQIARSAEHHHDTGTLLKIQLMHLGQVLHQFMTVASETMKTKLVLFEALNVALSAQAA
jgi:hypothetical protein